MKTVEAFNAFQATTGTVPAAIAGDAPMSRQLAGEGFDFSPAAYGYKRGCMVTVIAPLLEQRLGFCQTLNGGHDTDEGHWIWQSARALCEWLQSFHNITTSEDTVARALEAIIKTGRWIREKLGRKFGQRAFYYRPTCAESIPQQCGTDSAKARKHTDSTSERTTSNPGRCAFSEPSEPKRSRPVKPINDCCNPGLKPAEIPDWARTTAVPEEVLFTRLEPTDKAAQTTHPVQEAAPIEQTEPTSEDKGSEAPLNLLNRAGKTGWKFDPSRMTFVNSPGMPPRSVDAMAKQLQVAVDDLWAAVDHLIPV